MDHLYMYLNKKLKEIKVFKCQIYLHQLRIFVAITAVQFRTKSMMDRFSIVFKWYGSCVLIVCLRFLVKLKSTGADKMSVTMRAISIFTLLLKFMLRCDITTISMHFYMWWMRSIFWSLVNMSDLSSISTFSFNIYCLLMYITFSFIPSHFYLTQRLCVNTTTVCKELVTLRTLFHSRTIWPHYICDLTALDVLNNLSDRITMTHKLWPLDVLIIWLTS